VALVAERGTPLRCEFTPGQVTLRAGGTDDEGQAEEAATSSSTATR